MPKYLLSDEDFADGLYQILNVVDWKLGGGYDVSTGIDYRNEVFESFGFWGHCECDCTYETREYDWKEAHPHSLDCYQSLIRDLGFGYSWDTGRDYFEQETLNDEACNQAALALGIDPKAPGSYVHCTCGHTEDYIQWREEAQHDKECSLREYGFYHFESGLKVEWYKRVGRSTKSNMEMKPVDWYKLVVECLESVRDDGSTNHE